MIHDLTKSTAPLACASRFLSEVFLPQHCSFSMACACFTRNGQSSCSASNAPGLFCQGCARSVPLRALPLPFSPLSTHASHAPSSSISSQQEVTRESHHHPSTQTANDDDRALGPPQQTDVEKYNKRVDQFREQVLTQFRCRVDQDQEFLNAALDLIDQRAWDKRTRIVSAKYFVTALENFLGDERAVVDLKQELSQARARRERFTLGVGEQNHSAETRGQYAECVRFAVEESERTGRNANEILAEVLAARGIAP
jgi:hypothetical protein